MSGGSCEGHRKTDSFSSQDGLLVNSNGSQHYGSVGPKKVIMNVINNVLDQGHHRRTTSEVSTTSIMSAVSVDTSVEPVRVDPAKSSMFKEEISSGIVRLQLPKDVSNCT
jgi:hypothetical protein